MYTDPIICLRRFAGFDNIFTARGNLGIGLGIEIGNIESCVSTNTVCSTYVSEDDVTAACIQTQQLVGEVSLIMTTILLVEGI